jgi:hypothetical protein
VENVAPVGVMWTARIAWAAVGPVMVSSIATTDAPGPVTIGLWAVWGMGLVALLVPSTVGLTVTRLVIPASVPWSVIAAVVTDEPALGIAAIVLAVAATATTLSGEFGEMCVQASAYGAERRHLLRPPAPFIAPMVVLWALLVTAITAGVIITFGQDPTTASTIGGIALFLAAAAAAVPLGRRFHRFSRRWLVVVPAGVVLHDPVVLAETVMFRRNRLRDARATDGRNGDRAFDEGVLDLTGGTWGSCLELILDEPERFVRAPDRPNARPEQLSGARFGIAPTRTGRALSTLTSRN